MHHETGTYPEFDADAVKELFTPLDKATGLADEFFNDAKYKAPVSLMTNVVTLVLNHGLALSPTSYVGCMNVCTTKPPSLEAVVYPKATTPLCRVNWSAFSPAWSIVSITLPVCQHDFETMHTGVTAYLQHLLASLGESPIIMAASTANDAETNDKPEV